MFEKKINNDHLPISNSSLRNLKPGGFICSICKINPAQIYVCPICGRRSIFPCPSCVHSELKCPHCFTNKMN